MEPEHDEHRDLLAPVQGILFGTTCGVIAWLLIYVAIHVAVAHARGAL